MDFIGKQVRLMFDDLGRATAKIGELLEIDTSWVRIRTDKTEELIPRERIIRIELLKEDSHGG